MLELRLFGIRNGTFPDTNGRLKSSIIEQSNIYATLDWFQRGNDSSYVRAAAAIQSFWKEYDPDLRILLCK